MELLDAIVEEFDNLDAYDAGYVVGRITFEIVAAIGSAGTGVVANGVLKGTRMASVLTKLINWPHIPASIKAKLSQLVGYYTKMQTTRICFVEGTPVWTPSGPVAIETLREGDLVLSRDESTGSTAYKPVIGTITTHPESLHYIRVRSGDGSANTDTLICTGEHPFCSATREMFVPAEELVPGEELTRAGDSASALRF
ncbi:MAG: polymorphic toxin-type HINT domain-containing protein [Phycisphaerales bacterium]